MHYRSKHGLRGSALVSVVFGVILVSLLFLFGCRRKGDDVGGEAVDATAVRASQLLQDQRQNDQRIWRHEVEALEHESMLNGVVDQMRFARDRLAILEALSFGELRFRQPGPEKALAWGVKEREFNRVQGRWGQDEWKQWVGYLREAKVSLDYFSLQLIRFQPGSEDTNGLASGVASFECHAKMEAAAGEDGTPQGPATYHSLKGELALSWDRAPMGVEGVGPLDRISVEQLRWRQFTGERAFKENRRYAVGKPEERVPVRITPLLVRDLDGDLDPEIVLGGVNLLLRNEGDFQFQGEAFLEENVSLKRAAALADFNGDGKDDLLGIMADGLPILVEGGSDGTMTDRSRRPWKEPVPFPSSLATADIDGDGDLDVWVAQRRPTYHGGTVPESLTDARDGFPSRLYQNDGRGVFREITGEAKLGAQRLRRTKAAGFWDVDRDGDEDLLVASDYAGLELHQNDGQGGFTNVSDATFGQWRLFGLCLAVGRFDADAWPDIFVGGRWSTAMHRMDDLQLERADFPDVRSNAVQMASGNQLFLSERDYETGPFNADARHTGWTNSATAADFDNDGDDDLYVTTGHMTGRSVEDFDSQFWRHDIFLREGVSREVLETYFRTPALTPRLTGLRNGEISWYGYESNRLQVNGDRGFMDLAYLHGVALTQDSPVAVAADLNLDGRKDLLTVVQRTFVDQGRLAIQQSLVIYENVFAEGGHWLGVHLVPNAPGFLDTGVRVRIQGDFGVKEERVRLEFSGSVQLPSVAHFGLGEQAEVDHLTVYWANGHRQVLVNPAVDQYHVVSPALDFTPVPDPLPVVEEEEESDASLEEEGEAEASSSS